MQIELIGCTGAGKSTLLHGILRACHEQGLKAFSGDDYVLENAHLGWVRGHLARTLLVDFFSLWASLRARRRYSSFYGLVFGMIFGLKEVGWLERLNIIRNTLKKVGIYEIINRLDTEQHFILLDEGTLHTAHYLFVHLSAEFSDVDLLGFMKSVPVPDTVIYLRQEEEVLIERTMARGHKRIHDGSRSMTELFIKRAVTTFDKLAQDPSIASRMLVVDSARKIQLPQGELDLLSQRKALDVLRAGLFLVNASDSNKRAEPSLTL